MSSIIEAHNDIWALKAAYFPTAPNYRTQAAQSAVTSAVYMMQMMNMPGAEPDAWMAAMANHAVDVGMSALIALGEDGPSVEPTAADRFDVNLFVAFVAKLPHLVETDTMEEDTGWKLYETVMFALSMLLGIFPDLGEAISQRVSMASDAFEKQLAQEEGEADEEE